MEKKAEDKREVSAKYKRDLPAKYAKGAKKILAREPREKTRKKEIRTPFRVLSRVSRVKSMTIKNSEA